MPTLSPALREFYLLYLEWTWHNAPKTRIFSKAEGLCVNLTSIYRTDIISLEEHASAKIEQHKLFADHHKSIYFPFGERNFTKRRYQFTQHQCPLRLSWVAYCLNLLPSPNDVPDHSAFHLPYTHRPSASLPPPYFPIPDLPEQFFASDGSRKVLADSLVPKDRLQP